MRTDMTNDRSYVAITGPCYAVMLVFRDESEPDVFGWGTINDFFSRRCPTVFLCRQAVLRQEGRRRDHLRNIMNVSIEGESNVPEPDASISAVMAGEGDWTHRDARLLNRVVKGFFAEHRKVKRVEEAASSAGAIAQQISPFQVADPEAIVTIAGALKRIADHFDPPPPDVVDSVYVRQKLGCTTTWVAEMARNGDIPASCLVPGTGNGKPWKFYRSKIEKWIKER